jgi:hypothetical protein
MITDQAGQPGAEKFQSQVMPRTDLSFLGAGLTSLIRYHAKALREGKKVSSATCSRPVVGRIRPMPTKAIPASVRVMPAKAFLPSRRAFA